MSHSFPLTTTNWPRQVFDSSDPAYGLATNQLKITVVHGSDNHMFSTLHNVRWAAYSEGASVEDMGTYSFLAHVPMAQQLLDSPDVLSPFQQVCGKLHQVGIQILSPLLTRCGILPVLVLRK